jgi:hypothetical protein
MIVIKGSKTVALIFLPEDSLEESARKQIETIVDHPAMRGSQVRVMPDAHTGVL